MLSSCKNPNDFSRDINDVHITVQTHSDIIPILSKGLCVWPTHRRPVKTLLLFVFVFCSSFFLNFCEQLIHALTLNGFDSDTMTVIDGEGSFLTCSDLLSSSKHSLLVLSYWTVSLSPTWLLRQWPPAAWCQICRTTSFRLLTVIFLTDTDFKSDFLICGHIDMIVSDILFCVCKFHWYCKKKNIDVTLQKFTFFANTFFVRVVSSVCLLFFKKTWIGGCVGWLFETLLRFILTDIGRRHFLCVLWKEQLFVLHFSTTVTYVTQSHLVAAFLYISGVLHHSDIWNICSGLWGTLTNGS